MSKKMKLALLALLGFSTACSTVKNGTKESDADKQTIEEMEQPQIRVLYGVRPPKTVMPAEEAGNAVPAQDAPQTEKPQE